HRAWRHDVANSGAFALAAVGGDRRAVVSIFRPKTRRHEELTPDVPGAPGREAAHPVLRTGPALARGRPNLRVFASLCETWKRPHLAEQKAILDGESAEEDDARRSNARGTRWQHAR